MSRRARLSRSSKIKLLALAAALGCGGDAKAPPVSQAASGPSPGFDVLGAVVLEAAVAYPEIASEPAPPFSLTASDGTGLRVVSVAARAVVEGPLAFTELHLTFENPEDRVLEGRFQVTLPERAAISRLAMLIESGWQEAEVVERQHARRAYEDFLHRQVDPALMEKEAGNEFAVRIFPIPARARKEIILSYSQELPEREAPYVLPLRGLPEVESVRVTARIADAIPAAGEPTFRTERMEEAGWVPDRDFVAGPASPVSSLRAGKLVAARIAIDSQVAADPVERLAILFDTSASRALGFAREIDRLGELCAELARRHGPDVRLAVIAFDQDAQVVFDGRAGDFGRAALDALRARRPLGASDLERALRAAAAHQPARIVLWGDGVVTAGKDGAALRAALSASGARRLDVVLAGGIRDRDLAEGLSRGVLARDGAVLDGALAIEDLAHRLGRATLSGIEVSVPGAAWVWPRRLDGVQPGDELVVYAELGGGAGRPEVRLSGPVTAKVALDPSPATRPLLERAAARARIARLESERALLGDADGARRDALRAEIVELSTNHRVLSEHTALLVLETEEDYRRFAIDRRALADILTVGEQGIELVQRTDAVLIARPAPPPPPVTQTTAGDEGRFGRPGSAPGDLGGPADGLAEGSVAGGVEAEVAASEDPAVPLVARDEARAREPRTGSGAPRREASEAARRPAPRPSPAAPSRDRVGVAAPEPAPAVGSAPPRGDRLGRQDRRAETRRAPPSDEALVIADDREQAPQVDTSGGPAPYTGPMAEVMRLLSRGEREAALVAALRWQSEQPGDVVALIALGEALEAAGQPRLAARAYGSIIDLFPSRADLRRFAGARLQRLGAAGLALAADSFARAVADRPDHPHGHRLLAYALLRAGDHAGAFAALEAGLRRDYPAGRFEGVARVMAEDLGLLGAAWIRIAPARRAEIESRLAAAGARLPTGPSTRFVLHWETDANDVDLHVRDAAGAHAFYGSRELPSGGALYADVTTGYGPECFAIEGKPQAFPYQFQAHYYSRGPMGYGMGQLEIVQHDGNGDIRTESRPFVVMADGAYVDLGTMARPL